MFKCPICRKISSGKAWQEETKGNYEIGELVANISYNKDNAFFYCPVCHGESDGEYIEVGDKTILISKNEYHKLLEYKENYKNLMNETDAGNKNHDKHLQHLEDRLEIGENLLNDAQNKLGGLEYLILTHVVKS